MKQTLLLLFVSCCLFHSCSSDEGLQPDFPNQTIGLKPIYFDGDNWQTITTQNPRPLQNLGKFYYKDQMIYVSEKGQGIHIIDNTDPSNPQKIKFIQIPGAMDIAIKGNILYADNYRDLVALDISDLENIEVTKRIPNLYPAHESLYPSDYNGYFECVDPDKGLVIGWEQTELDNPKCRR